MHPRLYALLETFESFGDQKPTDLVSFVQRLPHPATLPSPWSTWILIGLARHRRRQHWVAEIIETRLHGDANDLAALGALGHPEDASQSGSVPGMSDWEYYFHGRGCCISHKVDGDAIDVDFWDESADYFDTFFYKNYLESLRKPEPPEQRVRELHPSGRAITIAIDDLIAAGALTPLPGRDSHPYRLSDEVVAVADAIDAFCTAWTDSDRRLVLAATIGDWLAAEEPAMRKADLSAFVTPRADACRELWQGRLIATLGDEFKSADALQALADLQVPELADHLETALQGPPTGKISAALDIIGKIDDASWCGRVYSLFLRVDPAGQLPAPHIWITSLKFLLRHKFNLDEVLRSLAKAGGTEVGEAVLLSLENAPELALPLIRNALLADIPVCRTQVAAILALIDAPWSKRELLGALEASDDQEKTADARAALLESGDPDAERAVLNWEDRNPHENEMGSYIEINGRTRGPFHTFGELSLRNRASRIAYEMQELHDRVIRVKNVIPPDPPVRRPWWKLLTRRRS